MIVERTFTSPAHLERELIVAWLYDQGELGGTMSEYTRHANERDGRRHNIRCFVPLFIGLLRAGRIMFGGRMTSHGILWLAPSLPWEVQS